MHKHRLCLRPNGRKVLVERGPSFEEIQKRGPANKKEAELLAAWLKKCGPRVPPGRVGGYANRKLTRGRRGR